MKGEAYQGFEAWWNPLRMGLKMHTKTLKILFMVHVTLIVLACNYFYGEFFKIAWDYFSTSFQGYMQGKISTDQFMVYAKSLSVIVLKKVAVVTIVTGAVYLLYPIALAFFKRRAEEQSANKYIKGARILTANQLKREIKRNRKPVDLPFGEVKIEKASEVEHCLFLGRPGSGKTVFVSQVLDRIRERDDRAIVYDFKGEYISRFYNPQTDIIFNPLDRRSVNWTLYNEIKNRMDIEAVAQSLIPPIFSGDQFWNSAARDLFSAILYYLNQAGKTTNRDLWDTVTANIGDLEKWLDSTDYAERGHAYIQDASGKMALSVYAVMMQYCSAIDYMSNRDGDFSIREWIDNGKGWIFLSNYADIQDALKPILSLFIDLMGRKLLTLTDDRDRRIFFIMDEFGTLQRLPALKNLMVDGRSKGASVWLGIQDCGQIEHTYGKNLRESLLNACGNYAFFCVGDPETAEYQSKRIGETQYERPEQAISMGVADNRDGISLTNKIVTERLILPAELMNLKKLTAYVKFSDYHLSQTRFNTKDYPSKNLAFEIAEGLDLDSLIIREKKIKEKAEEGKSFLQEEARKTMERAQVIDKDTKHEKREIEIGLDKE